MLFCNTSIHDTTGKTRIVRVVPRKQDCFCRLLLKFSYTNHAGQDLCFSKRSDSAATLVPAPASTASSLIGVIEPLLLFYVL